MQSERFTRFPEHTEGDTPSGLWERMHPTIPHPRNETYISTPLTSGPARLYVVTNELSLTADEVRARSMSVNSIFLDGVSEHLDNKKNSRLTLPHAIGKRGVWDQLEFNQFWLHYLSGASPKKAEAFNAYVQNEEFVDKELFNDDTADKNLKMREYQAFADTYVDFVKDDALNPVSKMIFMPGHEDSFGCTIEKMLAERLQIRQEFVIFDRKHKKFEEKVANNAPWLKDHPQIQENGGQKLIYFTPTL